MARRRAGLHGLQQHAIQQVSHPRSLLSSSPPSTTSILESIFQAHKNCSQDQFNRVGEQLAKQQLEQLQQQMQTFKQNLNDFAIKYRKDIKRDPNFRKHFQTMCAAIGVDPLACEFELGL